MFIDLKFKFRKNEGFQDLKRAYETMLKWLDMNKPPKKVLDYNDICFICDKKLKPKQFTVFSSEWDCWCHTKCCPKKNKKAKGIKECHCC